MISGVTDIDTTKEEDTAGTGDPDRLRQELQEGSILPHELCELKEAARQSAIAREALQKEMWWSELNYPRKNSSGLTDVKILSEYQVTKELIWALHTPADYFILYRTDYGFKPREGVSLSSVNQIDLYNEILSICTYLDIKETLDSFIKSIIETNIIDVSLPNTYIAYSSGLKQIISNYHCDLHAVESQVMKQENINTISVIINRLSPWFDVLQFLYNVHKKAIMCDWKDQDNWKCSIRLLAVLCDSLNDYEGWNKSLLMILFLHSLKPYLNIIERWLLNKSIIDHKNEFLIIRPSKSVGEENLLIRDYMEILNTVGVTNSLFIQNLIYFSYRACSSVDFLIILQHPVSNMEESTNSLNDEFLTCVLNDVKLLGVKFVDIPGCCFGEYLSKIYHLNHKLEPTQTEPDDDCFERMVSEGSGSLCSDTKMSQLLNVMFTSFRRNKESFTVHSNNRIFVEMESFNMNQVDIEKLLKDQFSSLISKWMQPKGFAKEILLVDYDLLGHLNALKMIYLLQEGVFINDFLQSLFTSQVSNNDDWLFISWTSKLQDFLCEKIPTYIVNFSIVFESYPQLGSSKHTMNILNSITIQYQRWPPLNLVITNSIIDRYNELFRFLIKLNWAYYSIKSINIKSFGIRGDQVTGRLYSLRMFLFHNILTLLNYFCSLINEESYEKVIHLCSIARDIQVITSALEKILDNLKKQCFLTDASVSKNIIKIFKLCGEVKSLFEESQTSIVLPQVLDLFETKYKETVFGLADDLALLDADSYFQKSSHFKHLVGEIMNNMPGDWDSKDS